MSDHIQQQIIAARKQQILDAATHVFAAKGFHPTTIRDIAKHAGIADGTIYNYFSSKPALLIGIFERMRDKVLQAQPLPADAPPDLRTLVHTFIAPPLQALKDDEFALFRVIFSEMMVTPELRTLYYQHVLEPTLTLGAAYLEEQAAHLGIKLADPRLTVRMISGMLFGLIIEYIMGDTALAAEWDHLPARLTDLLVDGLTGDAP
jgi:TetR/AcrR family fatty acid metabolism transcriptional regulator